LPHSFTSADHLSPPPPAEPEFLFKGKGKKEKEGRTTGKISWSRVVARAIREIKEWLGRRRLASAKGKFFAITGIVPESGGGQNWNLQKEAAKEQK
jgi:hypothetical protein